MRAVIVDDEPLAREQLLEMLEPFTDIEVIASYGNAVECLKHLKDLNADVLFLDIEMPQISGLEMANMLDPSNSPAIVFVTAYDQFALDAFEQNAVDYLLKPIDAKRLSKSIQRLKERLPKPKDSATHHNSTSEPSLQSMLKDQPLRLIPCYFKQRVKLIRLEDVEYASSDLSGVHVVTEQGINHTQLTLKVLEDKSPLLRCHRQHLVNVDAILEISLQDNGGAVLFTKSGAQLPVSRRYFKVIKDHFGL
ncbi:two-component system response regulator YehT [Alginatibacterium sediminis]|uniref:Two-component system response regulator YehT n=1 Tax=Alginatibacterium sediminis TaxID=2164068 RepID=A0A420E7N0_9ALTE|nr:two-component system response regulator BtsR [Alginatibacterium sediminis]RKF14458.1 two-component system response regulator YehT [Alginatibacterium sediminis]